MDIKDIIDKYDSWHDLNTSTNIENIKLHILSLVESSDESSINNGDYDCFMSISDIVAELPYYCSNDIEHLKVALNQFDNRYILSFITEQCIEELVAEGRLIYVYDRQRVRSRIAEITRYFAYLRQRMGDDYGESPSLVQMVKLKVKDRKKPKWEEKLEDVLQQIRRIPVSIQVRDDLQNIIDEGLQEETERFGHLAALILGTNGHVTLSKFQATSFVELFKQGISSDHDTDDNAYILLSGTGSGKTEAFMYPALLYTMLLRKVKGTKAIFLYPRIDLCNNQLERIVKYLLFYNQEIGEPKALKIGIHHSRIDSIKFHCPYDGCEGTVTWDRSSRRFICDHDHNEHNFDFIVTKQSTADIVITTPDSMHRRLMDTSGRSNLWDRPSLPRYIVFDEAHIYTSQSGMHVGNIIRRLKDKIIDRTSASSNRNGPIFIASSATIGKPEEFCINLFSVANAHVITPQDEDMKTVGREYILFVKATPTRKVQLMDPTGDLKDWRKRRGFTVASNLSCMIQSAFCLYHTMHKENGKDRLLGFVDSIDGIKRLGDHLLDAEVNRGLYYLRTPCHRLDPAMSRNYSNSECASMPPNPYLNQCQTYMDGECWWLMKDDDPMRIGIHKSGKTMHLGNDNHVISDEEWDLMITTSALEVGFDNPHVIGTFQYRSPRNVPAFVQRIGRGGRSQRDMPISLVVLGDSSLDNFYFHHTWILTDPTPDMMQIPIDNENLYVKTMHITSYLFDYISSHAFNNDHDDVYAAVNTEIAANIIRANRETIVAGIIAGFDLGERDTRFILEQVLMYLDSCNKELVPGEQSSKYNRLLRRNYGSTDILSDKLMPLMRISTLLEVRAANDPDARRDLERVRAAIQYCRNLINSNSQFKSYYMHIPDLFNIDPAATAPYTVPNNFIPMEVGGRLDVRLISPTGAQVFLESEPVDFMLSYFLPGGYKNRYGFEMYKSHASPSNMHGFVNIQDTFEFQASLSPAEAGIDLSHLPIELPADRTRIYIPKAIFLDKVGRYPKFYWDEEHHYVFNKKDDCTNPISLARDPTAFPLWELFPAEPMEADNTNTLYVEEPSLISEISYLPTIRLIKCFYANGVNLYADNTLTRLLKFRHDRDDMYAVIASEHKSEAVRFTVTVQPFLDAISKTLSGKPALRNDLIFAQIYRRLGQNILYNREIADSLYELDTIFDFIVACDSMMKREENTRALPELFDSQEKVRKMVDLLMPETEFTRLRYAGYDQFRKAVVMDAIDHHFDTLADIVIQSFDEANLLGFAETVLYETIIAAMDVWAHQFLKVGDNSFNLWSDKKAVDGCLTVIIYDNLQGGTGLSREMYRKLAELNDQMGIGFKKYIMSSLDCDIYMTESIVLRVLEKYDSDFLYNLFQGTPDDQNKLLEQAVIDYKQNMGVLLSDDAVKDIAAYVKMDVRRLLRSSDQAAFYRELAMLYRELEATLGRTPTVIDMIISISDDNLYDPRACQLLDRYRLTERGKITELFMRISEIVPTCVNACPECLDYQQDYLSSVLLSNLIDRRLLSAVLEGYNGF